MCYRVVERYSVCKCLYYKHSIDPCAAANQQGHAVQEKTILVGYLCSKHADRDDDDDASYSGSEYPDSGYASYSGSEYPDSGYASLDLHRYDDEYSSDSGYASTRDAHRYISARHRR